MMRGVGWLLAAVLLAGGTIELSAAVGAASAATPGPAPVAGAPGLSDGRAYEQVSPLQKDGSEAAAPRGIIGYSLAAASGESVLYYGSGPFGTSASGTDEYSVSRREGGGWDTSAALPPAFGRDSSILLATIPRFMAPSADLTRFLFSAFGSYVSEDPIVGEAGTSSAGIFLTGASDTVEPDWLTRPAFPSPFAQAKPQPGHTPTGLVGGPVGGSPDLSTVYFVYQGTLTPEDSTRDPQVGVDGSGPAGFYEWHEDALRSAGELPTGTYSPWGAVPAATGPATESGTGLAPRDTDNEVSSDGSKAFFVSPDPQSGHPSTEPAELYVREQTSAGPKTVLVSKSTLPGHEGEAAPGLGDEQAVVPNLDVSTGARSYVYAAPDGSKAFFLSTDKLARDAAGSEPEGSGPWMYEFDTQTENLTYLPNATFPILAASPNGNSFLFEKQEKKVSVNSERRERLERELREECEEEEEIEETTLPQCTPPEIAKHAEEAATEEVILPVGLDVWVAGEDREIAQWTTPITPDFSAARVGAGGASFVFDTDAVLAPGDFNNANADQEIYRYDVGEGTLSCISCPPTGASASGDAVLSHDERSAKAASFASSRGIAAEGEEIFFDTPTALVSGDVDGVRDVYEWHAGVLSLISSGTSSSDSFYLDNGESGRDVFFATRQELVTGDGDGSYDVYDARVEGGFPHQASPRECTESCQSGSQAPASLLAAPSGSALYPGGQNVLEPPLATKPKPKPKPKRLTRAQKLAKALKACNRKRESKRAACKRQARKRYGKKHAGRD